MLSEWLWSAWAFISPAVMTTAFLGAVTVAFRNAIGGWLTARTKHHYDAELERIRSEGAKATEAVRAGFAREIESLKAELAEKGKDVEALRAASLGARAARQALLEKRRLEAIDQVWGAIKELEVGKASLKTLGLRDKNPKEYEKGPYSLGYKFLTALKETIAKQGYSMGRAHNARPYISAKAWALYSVYFQVSLIARLRVAAIDNPGLAEFKSIQKDIPDLLIVAMPDSKDFIEENGLSGYPVVLEDIERELLADLQCSLHGEESDRAEVDYVSKILDKVRDVSMRSGVASA